jgi:hypothetical protein
MGTSLAPVAARWQLVLILLAAAGLGALIGWGLRGLTLQAPATTSEAPPRAGPETERSVVCAREPSSVSADDLRARWCEAQLSAAEQRMAVRRLPWPDGDLGAHDPAGYPMILEDALASCGGALEVADCSEYPCVAVVDLGGMHSGEVFERCPALVRALGEADVYEVPLLCPDGTPIRAPVLISSDDEVVDSLVSQLGVDDEDGFGRWVESVRLLARRIDEVTALATHLCPDGG